MAERVLVCEKLLQNCSNGGLATGCGDVGFKAYGLGFGLGFGVEGFRV